MHEITKKLIERADKKNSGLLKPTPQGAKINEGKWGGAEKSNCCS
jgi:hypothetical protein